MKRCTKCGEEKELGAFSLDRRKSDGRQSRCKACRAAVKRALYGRDPQRFRDAAKVAYHRDPGTSTRRRRERRATPQGLVEHRFDVRGLSRVRGAVDYGVILLDDPCSYCGGPGGQIDHIDPLSAGGEHDVSNLTSACASCNPSKGDKPLLVTLLDMKGAMA